ncbi:MAG TPA: hypothetical protein VGS27_12655 [Candidatus Sulfotelmatobacter sp.]|nr:hypothetical protein [Candidatus Sulfotelmatobacter sp.]
MSSSALRAAMVPITRQMRAYFAPVNRATETPTVFDPSIGTFLLSSPPSPWIDLGWVENFERWYDTPTDVSRSGAKEMPGVQFRGPLDARVSFSFMEWGKLQMALACGAEHMNVLAAVAGSAAVPSGGTPMAAVAVLPGSTASELIVGAGGVQAFPAGTLIAVDVDYQQQTGYVGTGIAGAYVRSAAAVQEDPNYVRRVTFNVARVAEVTATSIVLAQPLVGGAPANGASVQRVVAFVDREGGSFFQEWSALFVAQEENGGRVCFYYPRLSPNPGSAPGTSWNSGSSGVLKASASNSGRYVREEYSEIAKPLTAISLRASFLALPYIDANDGQTVLCYRSYFPAGMAASY